jgi:hypothetical protein
MQKRNSSAISEGGGGGGKEGVRINSNMNDYDVYVEVT